MSGKRFLAFDMGSDMIRAAVAEIDGQSDLVIKSVKETQGLGVRDGEVVSLQEVKGALSDVLRDLRSDVDSLPASAFVGLGGKGLEVVRASGSYALSGGRGVISQDDIAKSCEIARSNMSLAPGRFVMHFIVEEYVVGNTSKVRDPLNLPGSGIEAKTLALTSSQEIREGFRLALEACGVRPASFSYNTLCAAEVMLSEDQKDDGAIVIDIGYDGSNMVAYQEGRIVFAGRIPFGSASVTRDLQYILQRPKEDADRIKEECAFAYPSLSDPANMVEIPASASQEAVRIAQSEISQIVSSRYAEMFIMLKEKLSAASRHTSFANGIFLLGGGALQRGVAELAGDVFRLPARIAVPESVKGLARECVDPRYVNVLSLLEYNLNLNGILPENIKGNLASKSKVSDKAGRGEGRIKGLFKRLF